MCTACKHETPKGMAYDHSICLDCYSIFTDTRWGVASLKWFRNRDAAEFYRATGRYPDGDDPRDAEISSLTARVEELERAHAWQPIETAPITPMFEVIIAGQYDNGIWYVEEGFRNPLGHWNGRKITPPSHWMLLPPAPSEARTTLDAAIKTEGE